MTVLSANGYTRPSDPVFIQSFEVDNLKYLNTRTNVPLVQLAGSPTERPFDLRLAGDPRTYGDLLTARGLAGIAEYAEGIGPPKNSIVPRDSSGNLLMPTTLVSDAHDVGLQVHPYTFRNENTFLPRNFQIGDPRDPNFLRSWGDAGAEYALFFSLGIDGVFTDFPGTAVDARANIVPEPKTLSLVALGLLSWGVSRLFLRMRRMCKELRSEGVACFGG